MKEDDVRFDRQDRYPYRCQVCSIVENELGIEFISGNSDCARSASLNLHNLNVQLNIGREIEQLLQRVGLNVVLPDGQPANEKFWSDIERIYDNNQAQDLARPMAYVRLSVEEGLDAANERYRIPWSGEAGNTIEHRGMEVIPDESEDIPKPHVSDDGLHHIRDVRSISGLN